MTKKIQKFSKNSMIGGSPRPIEVIKAIKNQIIAEIVKLETEADEIYDKDIYGMDLTHSSYAAEDEVQKLNNEITDLKSRLEALDKEEMEARLVPSLSASVPKANQQEIIQHKAVTDKEAANTSNNSVYNAIDQLNAMQGQKSPPSWGTSGSYGGGTRRNKKHTQKHYKKRGNKAIRSRRTTRRQNKKRDKKSRRNKRYN